MRGATAKTLRRRARESTQGMPAVAYVGREHKAMREGKRTVEAKQGETGAFAEVMRGATKFFKRETVYARVTSTEVRLDPGCTKGYYRHLKRMYKLGEI